MSETMMSGVEKKKLAEIKVMMSGVWAPIEYWVIAMFTTLSQEKAEHVVKEVRRMNETGVWS